MQSIIFLAVAIVSSVLLNNFLICASKKNGNDFTIKEYLANFSIKNISIVYMLVFFALYEIMYASLEVTQVIVYLPLCFSLILAFIMDIKYMIIPDSSSIIIAICGVINIIINFSKDNVISGIIGMLIGGAFFLVIDLIFKAFTGKVGFGAGDMKLLAAIGLFYGMSKIIVIIIFSIVVSAIYSIAFLIYCWIKKKKCEYLPFAPFIVISTFIISIVPVSVITSTYFNIIQKIIE